MIALREAIDVSSLKKEDLLRVASGDLEVTAWHGTNAFWAVWFCVYGIDGTVTPPTKTLGRGNCGVGFSKISDPGLYVSAKRTPGFLHYVKVDVKPSELRVSQEMAERGHSSPLEALKLGDCVISAKIPARRISIVKADGREMSRSDFLLLFPDPVRYLQSLYDVNMYHQDDNELLRRASVNFMFKEFRELADSGTSYLEIAETIEDMISHGDFHARNVPEEDARLMLDWARSKEA